MLYPKEDSESQTLMFACRTCQFSEPATAACVWRNSLKEDVQETAGNVEDVAQDPTVGTSSKQSIDDDDEVMNNIDEDAEAEGELDMPDFCTLCGNEILCPICEMPSDGGIALEVDDPGQDVEAEGERVIAREKQEREHA